MRSKTLTQANLARFTDLSSSTIGKMQRGEVVSVKSMIQIEGGVNYLEVLCRKKKSLKISSHCVALRNKYNLNKEALADLLDMDCTNRITRLEKGTSHNEEDLRLIRLVIRKLKSYIILSKNQTAA